MLKNYFFYFLFFFTGVVFSQNEIYISGKIIDDLKDDNDSIYFSPYFDINKDYYEVLLLSSEVKNKNFILKEKFSYPQMYGWNLKSEKGIIPQKVGMYFIDQTTKSITADSSTKNIEVFGVTGYEYKNKFAPFFLEKNSNESLDEYKFYNAEEFDSKLLTYVIQNPNSYVALWNLINRFSTNGYSDIYGKMLNSFSNAIRKGKLWKVLNEEMKLTRIRINEKFPELVLKNVDLTNGKIIVPKAKYVFIDLWFSRCKPCLAQLPALKKMYAEYKVKGFEIISISTDKTKDIETWKKRINEYEIPWKNYLDENATESDKEKIFSFPTTFLIDQTGKVLKKNIELQDLEKLLEENLK